MTTKLNAIAFKPKKERLANKIMPIYLTEIELKAALTACSNYTPHGSNWKRGSQARAARKFQNELMRLTFIRGNKPSV